MAFSCSDAPVRNQNLMTYPEMNRKFRKSHLNGFFVLILFVILVDRLYPARYRQSSQLSGPF